MRLFEEKFELFFHPGDHLVVLVQDATLAQQESHQGVLVCQGLTRQGLIDRLE